jgi:hypothetical protein
MSGSLIPNAKQQFLDANGNPLAGGFVYYYIPATTTFKNTYQNTALTILNSNPIILDSAGECIAYGNGSYRQIVTDVNGNLIWDQPTIASLNDATTVIYTPPFNNSVAETVSTKLSENISVKDFGAKGDGTTDDTVAIQNAITACGVSYQKVLFFPAGIYLVTSTLNFNGVSAYGEGLNWQSSKATEIRANASNILLATLSNAKLANLVFNGNNLALWGLMVNSVRCEIDNIQVIKAKEYGCIMNASQNGIFTNLNCRFSKYNLVLANGTRNCNFYNFTSSVETAPSGGNASVDSRNILFLIDTSNPYSFGLSTSVVQEGNDRLNFFGGISETFNSYSNYVIETKNNSGFSGNTAGNIMFWGYELDSGKQILLTDSTFTGKLNFYNTYWGWANNSTAATSGTAGYVNFYNGIYLNGGNNISEQGITQNTNYYQGWQTSTNIFSSVTLNSQYYLAGGGSTVTFNATTKVFSVSSGTSVQGVGIILQGGTLVSSTLNSILPIIKVTFNVSNIVGGSQISVSAGLTASPFRNLIANVSAGPQQLLYKCSGNENGSIEFALNSCTSFDVSDIKIELI